MSGRYEVERETRLDILVAELMGSTADRAVEAVLDANPGLSALGPVIPVGTIVDVPDLPVPTPIGTRVWE